MKSVPFKNIYSLIIILFESQRDRNNEERGREKEWFILQNVYDSQNWPARANEARNSTWVSHVGNRG